MRLSGLQKEVLALYRQCLREARKKPESTRPHFESFARAEFARSLAIDKREFAAIEFLLRKGRRQLDVYSSPGIKDVR
ncbi:complex 1 protein (LYR family) domain-containing protein [Hirsutella rhossiliensis]|uniref:Complex 1 protein (LYR family) domain-containing protein n=1 Tax=Hirsutella rhossiliensis TaxID=111463 RepID=A0A9P8MJ94_9HYPO|nr:complex 1 protein (LYR family) domain-containing protein [Hirsutella rhossiliensis]KAH0957373.1 complex 1 protein (LYR family) domain-containing protein [Hirsutella rhossiliensis]